MVLTPLYSGQALLITLSGDIKQNIAKGAYVKLTVKYGLIQLISTTADFCEQAANVNLSCPLQSGKITITKSVDMPSAIPPVRSSPLFLSRGLDANVSFN